MTRRKRVVCWTLGMVLVVVACEQAWRHGHDYIFADQFAEVVPGTIFRGAWQQSWPMHRLIDQYRIKTIVALAHTPDNPLALKEKELAERKGCRWIHIPIVDDRSIADQKALGDRLEAAAAALADPTNQPVYFHCHHGINRASMVQIAYRTLYCGWTLEQAHDEIARTFGLKRVDHGPDYRYMARFYRERVLPRRQVQAASEGARRG